MNTRTPLIASALLAASLISGAAHAALEGRDINGSADSFEAYYDTDLNITWLAGANYAKTSGYDADGQMIWADANTWAANLSFTDGVHTYDNWRLPTVNPINGSNFNYVQKPDGSADWGYNIGAQGSAYEGSTANEMAHLFYAELGNKAYYDTEGVGPQAGWGLTNVGPFTNLQASLYWSDTESVANTNDAWAIDFKTGGQFAYDKSAGGFYALAVTPGDVAAIPEADTWAMLLAGLGLVGFMARRRKQTSQLKR